MITGVPLNKEDTDTWRVVLTGPKFDNGFSSKIVYEEPETPVIAPPPTGGDPGSVPIDSSGGFSTGSGDIPTSDSGSIDEEVGGTDPVPAETEGPPALATEGAETTPQGFPAYVWLAVLGGIMGFALVRSVVLESASGIRPNGVLATIHRLNAEGGGAEAAAAAASGGGVLSAVGNGFKTVGGKIGSIFKFGKKG
jgi:hypothetical protein